MTTQPTRVLITHRYFWPENLSLYPAMLKDVAEWHVRCGHETTVLTAGATDAAKRRERHDWASEHGVRLIEAPLDAERGKSRLARFTSIARYTRLLRESLSTTPADLVIVGSYPPVAAAWAARSALRRSGAKLLYYVQDILPEMLSQQGGVLNRLAGWGMRRVDRENLAGVDACVTISAEMRQTLLARGHCAPIHVLPNYAIEPFEPAPRPAGAARPRLVFAGNQGRVQNVAHFCRAAAAATADEAFDVEIIGGGSEHQRLRRLVQELGCDHIRFTDELSREEAQRRIAVADIGVVAASPGLYRVAYPSKANSYLAAGLPVLVFADDDSFVAGWLREHRLGATASPTDVANAARSITRMVRAVREDAFNRRQIAATAADLLSPARYLDGYANIVRTLLPSANVVPCNARMIA